VLTCPTSAIFAGSTKAIRCPGQEPALLRRRLADQQADRRQALLAHSGDGRRVLAQDTAVVKASAAATCCCWRATPVPRWPPPRPRRRDARLPNVVMPFPGGVVRSGSKVGSKYKALIGLDQRRLLPQPGRPGAEERADAETRCVMEIVIDGLTEADVGAAMRVGMEAVHRASARRAGCCASRPATTAASSGRSTSTCTSCSGRQQPDERLDLDPPNGACRCGWTCAACRRRRWPR
jgi:formylmethanofuran--tetrahydromethanopterin N-formyltransferase